MARVGNARIVIREVKINAEEDVAGGDQVYVYAIVDGPSGRSTKTSEVKQGSEGETLTFEFRAFDQLIREGDVYVVRVIAYEKDWDFDDPIVVKEFYVRCPDDGAYTERSSYTGETAFASYTVTYEFEVRCAEVPDAFGLELPDGPPLLGRDRKFALLSRLTPERLRKFRPGCCGRQPPPRDTR